MNQTKPVSFRGALFRGRTLASQALAAVALRKSSDITMDQLRQNVSDTVRADSRFPTVKSKVGGFPNTPWLRDVAIPETDGGEWTAIVQQAAENGSGDMVKIGFTIATDGTVTLAKGDPQPTKMIYKSASFSGVIGGSARREHARDLVAATGDVLRKSDDATPKSAPERTTFAMSFALVKGNSGHTGKSGGGSRSQSVSVGKTAAAKKPRFRIGQRVTTGDGKTGKVVGNSVKGGEHYVEISVGRGQHMNVAESDCTLTKSCTW